MGVSRRNFLALAAAGVAAAALDVGILYGSTRPALADTPGSTLLNVPGRGLFGGLTTLDRTFAKSSTANALGYRKVVEVAGGEVYTTMGIDGAYRHPLLALGAFAQMTDLQLADDQSPMRVEFTDRQADLPNTGGFRTDSAYRPHEMLSTHIVESMTQAINNVGYGPMTGMPLAFTILTGDMVDNCQYNETRWYINLLDGGQSIRPDSGDFGKDESVSNQFGNAILGGHGHDLSYWYPEAQFVQTGISDGYQKNYGFPFIPGLLAAARQPYTSTGLKKPDGSRLPWYAAMGNHDGAVQGNLPLNPAGIASCVLPNWHDLAVGGRKPYNSTDPLPADPGGLDIKGFCDDLVYASVTADDGRKPLDQHGFAREHFTTAGLPVGHGFTYDSHNDVYQTYYAIPPAAGDLVQYITLDTVNYNGHDAGHLPTGQFIWLETQLKANSSRYLDDSGHWVTASGVTDKLFVIFSHHTIDSMDNTFGDPHIIDTHGIDHGVDPAYNRYGADLKRLLLRYPNVILMVNGHTHANIITPHRRSELFTGTTGGFWEVNTASHIDWPSQSRIVELTAGSGFITIYTTIVDIAAPSDVQVNGSYDLSTPTALASVARELAANDPTERPKTRSGATTDRNAELRVPAPFTIPMPWDRGSSVAVACWNDGHMEVFGTKPDDTVWTRWEGPAGSDSWSDWLQFPGLVRSVAAEVNGYGGMDLYGVNAQGAVFRRPAGPSSWGAWQGLGAIQGTAIAAAHNADGRMEMYVTLTDGTISQRYQTSLGSSVGNETWSAWASWSFGGATGKWLVKVAATMEADGRIELFAADREGTVYRRRQGTPNAGWEDWIDFGTVISSLPLWGVTAIAATRFNDGRLVLYAIDYSRKVYQVVQSSAGSNTWGSWALVNAAGKTAARMTQLAARSNSAGVIELFGVDHTGQLWRCQQTAANSLTYTAWSQFTGTLRPDVPRAVGSAVPVPSVIGLNQTDATNSLLGVDLWVGSVTSVHNSSTPGTVVTQSPAGGSTALLGSANSVVNLGLADGWIQVPSLDSETAASAENILGSLGLSWSLDNDYSCIEPAGWVVSSSPTVGTWVPPGSTVKISVSTGTQSSGAKCGVIK